MRRRDFLAAAAGTMLLPCRLRGAAATECRPSEADRLPRDVNITRIVGFDLISRRSKVVGKNSRRGVHGDRARDRMVRIFTNAGLEGLGSCGVNGRVLAGLLGKNPFRHYDTSKQRITGPLGSQTMPLWDLAGKVLKKPAYQLFGGKGPKRVPVYDGSYCFQDLLPQHASRWKDRFKEEIDTGLKLGHQALKLKVGRGAKWMERAAGDARDIEVLQLVRKHLGRDGIIGTDANNGYDLAGTKRFLARAGELDMAFVEEMFPEQVDQCLELKRFIAAGGWKTLLADGETQGNLDAFKPFIRTGAIDVLQGDMRRFGFEGILTEAAWARPQGVLVAPHNWGSLVGFYMQLHVGRAITNFYRAEHDPLSTDLLIADGYKIADGTCTVPDAPGFGLKLDEKKLSDIKVAFDLRA